jgi:hypothetical protein
MKFSTSIRRVRLGSGAVDDEGAMKKKKANGTRKNNVPFIYVVRWIM